ncbi:intermembrane phospholipid transport protein YdbH family protein [Altererythrobacter lutimaris]|nr:YdbH domain-containing protein [Altererythrobacter lutimaris]
MPEGQSPLEAPAMRARLWPRRKRWQFVFGVCLLLIGLVAYAWFSREQIAREIISDELDRLNIPASYSINSIGPEVQVLHNVVLGDPDRPDFTADEVRVKLVYGLEAPTIGQISLLNPRLFGSYRNGQLSFGSLDSAIFAPSEEAPALPDMDMDLRDGRALIESDFGDFGIKAEGQGNLADGFVGVLAVSAPELANESCRARDLSVFGQVKTSSRLPSFNGPVRVRGVSCADQSLAANALDWQLELTGESDFSGFDADGAFDAQSLSGAGVNARSARGETRITLNGEGLRSRFDITAQDVANDTVRASSLNLAGGMRAQSDLTWINADVDAEASDVRLAETSRQSLDELRSNAAFAPFAPLMERLKRGLDRAQAGNSLRATVNVRQSVGAASYVIPQALMQDDAGVTIASLSRVRLQYSDGDSVPRIDGNAVISGRDLPQITARMEQLDTDASVMRVRMEPYAAGGASLSLPELAVSQDQSGALRFAGRALASGAMEDGATVDALSLPLQGRWDPHAGLAAITRCASVMARRISYSGIDLFQPRMELCPSGQRAAFRLRDGVFAADLRVKPMDLSGIYDGQPISLTSGAIAFSSTRGLAASDVSLALGKGEGASRFALAELNGAPGDAWSGEFSDAAFALGAVPLDISDSSGAWRFADGELFISDGALKVSDREADPRFEPLVARGAAMSFEDGLISASADLREPFSDRLITRVLMQHDLESGSGSADLLVRDLRFDEGLQPAAGSDVCLNRASLAPDYRPSDPGLSCLALGIIANVEGSVSGQGQINWTPDSVTSSGDFTTMDADMAAAFGPLRGVSGTVRFTDLLELTTAPNQVFNIDAVNPGIEVFDGTVAFNLSEGQVLEIEGGRWPFMGGELALEPALLDFREPMDRRYVLLIDGLDAARFIEQMELGNISASGVFDGAVPIVFDTDGNGRIEQGLLTSRQPGGNVSYIGELTYEDLGAMANFAFQSLRSLDFTQMEVEMNGPLTGEIITRLKFDGVSQGEGASNNLITRQIAKLPIQFRVNIRADFYSLLTNLQSMYDPAFVRDPRELGLLESDGTRFTVPQPPEMPALKPEDPEESDNSDEPAIQPQESEALP